MRRAAGQGLAERAGVRGIGDVPQPDRAVGAAAGQRVPAGAERHRHTGAAAGQGLAERAGVRGIGDVPQPDGAVLAAAGQRAPAGAERHRARWRCRRSGAGRAGGGARDRPRPTAGPCPRRCALASVRPPGLNATESTAPRRRQGLAERAGVRGIGDVPQPDRAVGAAAGQRAPAGAERHRGHRVPRAAAGRGWPSGRGCAGSATSHSRTTPVDARRWPACADRG